MENASNALQLAFGMIIGVLLLSLLVFLFRNISIFENSKRDSDITQETADFNKQFLAFDKTLMYGTDVISVLGLAISNNRIQYQSKVFNLNSVTGAGKYRPELEFSVNIEITFDKPVYARETRTVTKVTNAGEQVLETDIAVAMEHGLDPTRSKKESTNYTTNRNF